MGFFIFSFEVPYATDTVRFTLLSSFLDIFIIAVFASWLLGIIILELSTVVRTVYRIWIHSTVPSPDPLFIYSPFKKGLKNSIKTPPAPTANPAVPSSMIREVAFTPNPPITKKKNPI